MIISEVIAKLQEIQATEGDLKVCFMELDHDVHEDVVRLVVEKEQLGWKSNPRKETEKVVSIYSW